MYFIETSMEIKILWPSRISIAPVILKNIEMFPKYSNEIISTTTLHPKLFWQTQFKPDTTHTQTNWFCCTLDDELN